MKKVGIIMGSDSDLPIVQKAIDVLRQFEVPAEVHVFSAHRTPLEAKEFAQNARANGIGADRLLAGIIPLFELDAYATPVVMMAAVPGDTLDPAVEAKYRKALGYDGTIERMERFAFYERAKKAYAVVVSGETAKYGNIILKKGVTPVA